MPSNCAVSGCFSTSKKSSDIIFHGFPKKVELRQKWIHLCRRPDPINANNAKICSLHFEPDAYERNLKYELLGLPVPRVLAKIKDDVVPTRLLPRSKDVVSHGSAKEASKRSGSSETSQEDSEKRKKIKATETKGGNTKKKNAKWGLNVFIEWLEANGLPAQFETLPKEELDQLLARLYVEAQNERGEMFTKTAFLNLRDAIQKHLQGSPWNVKYVIKTDHAFSYSNKILQDMKPHYCPIRCCEVRHLVKTGTLGMHNPKALQNLVWISVALHFGKLTVEQWINMTKKSFIHATDERGIDYIGWSDSSTKYKLIDNSAASSKRETCKMFASPADPVCPVKAFDKYISLLNPEIDEFWQKPNASFEKTSLWYSKQVVGKQTILHMMKNMCLQAKLNKQHLNSCLHVTSPAVLMEADIQESDIVEATYIMDGIDASQQLPEKREGENWSGENVAECYEDMVMMHDTPSPNECIKCEDIKIEDEDPLAVPALPDLHSDTFDDDEIIPRKRCRLESDGNSQDSTLQENTDQFVVHFDDGLSHQQMKVTSHEDEELGGTAASLRDSSPASEVEDDTLETHQAIENSTTLQHSQLFGEVQKKDIYDEFSSHIAKTLRDLNDLNTFRRVQIEINNILLEALAGKFKCTEFYEKQTSRVLSNNFESPVLATSSNSTIVNNAQTTVVPVTANNGSPLVYIINSGQVSQSEVNSQCMLQNSGHIVQNTVNTGHIVLNPVCSGPAVQRPFNLGQLVNNPLNLWQMIKNPQTPGQVLLNPINLRQMSEIVKNSKQVVQQPEATRQVNPNQDSTTVSLLPTKQTNLSQVSTTVSPVTTQQIYPSHALTIFTPIATKQMNPSQASISILPAATEQRNTNQASATLSPVPTSK